MATEEQALLQELLRASMRIIINNQGVMNLQKGIPQLSHIQDKINKLNRTQNIYDIINHMSI